MITRRGILATLAFVFFPWRKPVQAESSSMEVVFRLGVQKNALAMEAGKRFAKVIEEQQAKAEAHQKKVAALHQEIMRMMHRKQDALKAAIKFIALHTPFPGEIGDEWDQIRDQLRDALHYDGREKPQC